MDTLAFLKAVLPSKGWYFVAIPTPGTKKGFKHHPCESVEELAAKVMAFDKQGATVYYATASYREKSVPREKDGQKYFVHRVQQNVQYVRSFWLDLDVSDAGDAKHYSSQAEAVQALGKFAFEVGLPKPVIVNSGYGIHAYWPLTADVLPSQWKTTAENLKLLTAHMGMLSDPSRTADSASVLRPPGTVNRKAKLVGDVMTPSEAPVIALGEVAPVEWKDFDRAIRTAMKERQVSPPKQTAAQVNAKINAGATVANQFPPASAHAVADHCRQVNEVREKLGNVPEPLWYAAIQLLDKTIEGDEIIHEWSKGYKGYTESETNQKIQQVKQFGPTSCATFESRNPGGCEGCLFRDHVSTPIQLGVKLPEAPPPVVNVETDQGILEVEIPNPPAPFQRGDGEHEGLYVSIEGVPIRFYPYDLYPSALEYDEADQFETTRIHHRLPLEGWREFLLRSSLVHSPKEFNTAMADQSVKYNSDGKYKDTMRKYMAGYLTKLQEKTRIKAHYKACGWKEEDTKFLLGNRMFAEDGSSYHAGISRRSSIVGEAFGVKGEFEPWYQLTKKLDTPGWEHHAFTLMIAFGAPLLHLAGLNGTLINMVGPTGAGKSVSARWMFSVYGNFDKAFSTENATALARLAKLGSFGNLPLYIDELTKMEPKDLSKLAYDIANGGGRERLKSDSSLDEVIRWSTFVLSSSNNNLHDKLTLDSSRPEAQTMRIFEYRFPKPAGVYDFIEHELLPVLTKNYGHAGERYISYLIQQDKSVLAEEIKKTKDWLTEQCNGKGQERFWFFTAACIVYGGILAKHCGLIDFDPMRVVPWIKAKIEDMRQGMQENFGDELELLSRFLDEHQSERINISMTMVGGVPVSTLSKTTAAHSPLTQRLELTGMRLFISSHTMKNWLLRKGEDYASVVAKLKERKILVNTNRKVALGAGTQYQTQSRSICWELDLNAAEKEGLNISAATLDKEAIDEVG